MPMPSLTTLTPRERERGKKRNEIREEEEGRMWIKPAIAITTTKKHPTAKKNPKEGEGKRKEGPVHESCTVPDKTQKKKRTERMAWKIKKN